MFKNLFNQPQTSEPEVEVIEISADPRSGIFAPSPGILAQWIEQDAEVIDLGAPQRDQAILPTTWHIWQ